MTCHGIVRNLQAARKEDPPGLTLLASPSWRSHLGVKAPPPPPLAAERGIKLEKLEDLKDGVALVNLIQIMARASTTTPHHCDFTIVGHIIINIIVLQCVVAS